MATTTANLGLTLPTPNVDTGWGSTLNTDFTLIDNLFALGGNGTSVGLNIGSGKTLGIGGTLLLGTGDGTGSVTAPTIRGAARTGTNATGANLTIDAANGTGTGGSGAIIFRTAPAGAGGTTANTFQNSLVIDNGQNVAIGTTSTPCRFNVEGGTWDEIARFNGNSDPYLSIYRAGTRELYIQTTSSSVNFVAEQSKPVLFYTASGERVRIGTAGQIGIAGANYGTANQVLTSNGPSASVSWKDPGIASLPSQIFAAGGNSFYGIPSWAKSITITVAGMDPTADVFVRIGTSAGFVVSGYNSSGSSIGASGASTGNGTTGFLINITGSIGSGTIRLNFVNGVTWSCDHVIGTTTTRTCVGGGSVALPGALDRVQIIPATGTFAASGAVNVFYQ
jgi:hypothetical protein